MSNIKSTLFLAAALVTLGDPASAKITNGVFTPDKPPAVKAIEEVTAAPVKAEKPSIDSAKQYASDVATKVLTIMNEKGKSQADKLATLEDMFVNVVDVNWVGRFVLGQYWRGASETQKTEYIDAYRAFLIKHYTSRFAEYSGETFAIPMARDDGNGEYLVRMVINRTEGKAPVTVDYRLRTQADNSFKVFDIIVEGVSLITTQRSEFASVVNRDGLDTLITKLKTKTAKLAKQMQE